MTSSGLQQHHPQQQQQPACIEPSAAASRSVVDAWLRKLRLHSKERDSMSVSSPTQCASQSNQQPKRKQPSFIKALFKPHELKAIKNSSPEAASSNNNNSSSSSNSKNQKKTKSHSRASESNQALDQQQQSSPHSNQSQHVVPPVEIPSSYMGRSATHYSIMVGGRHVPFTRDAHLRMKKKKSVKALASVAETHPVSSLGSMSMAAYRSRAYYPAASSSSKQRREKR
ncbi:hypothetical protein Gpo141_00002249 [Globisporangium polare]